MNIVPVLISLVGLDSDDRPLAAIALAIGTTNIADFTEMVAMMRKQTLFAFSVAAAALLLPTFTLAFARWGPSPESTDPNYRHRHGAPPIQLQQHSNSNNNNGDRTQSVVDSPADFLKTVDVLSLDSIRSSLIRQEETIIFALIERAQFRQNAIVYRQKGGFGHLGIPPGSVAPLSPLNQNDYGARTNNDDDEDVDELSFLEYMLVGTEALHCAARRYLSPEEHAFFPERIPSQPMPALPSLQYSPELLSSEGGASRVNFNKRLLQQYINVIVPAVCESGDDEQHGSAVLCDIAVLQALSRRVHCGKFVAESKYRSDPEAYQRLVAANDADGVLALLTNAVVEEQVLRRSRLKAATYGSEPLLAELPPMEGSDSTSTIVAAAAASAVVAALGALNFRSSTTIQGKVDPSVIEQVYRDIIIPMTKEIEVAYLFLRCGRQPPPEYQ